MIWETFWEIKLLLSGLRTIFWLNWFDTENRGKLTFLGDVFSYSCSWDCCPAVELAAVWQKLSSAWKPKDLSEFFSSAKLPSNRLNILNTILFFYSSLWQLAGVQIHTQKHRLRECQSGKEMWFVSAGHASECAVEPFRNRQLSSTLRDPDLENLAVVSGHISRTSY